MRVAAGTTAIASRRQNLAKSAGTPLLALGFDGWLGPSLRSPSEMKDVLAILLGLRRLSPSHPDFSAIQIPTTVSFFHG
jgi:hypothetical protein